MKKLGDTDTPMRGVLNATCHTAIVTLATATAILVTPPGDSEGAKPVIDTIVDAIWRGKPSEATLTHRVAKDALIRLCHACLKELEAQP